MHVYLLQIGSDHTRVIADAAVAAPAVDAAAPDAAAPDAAPDAAAPDAAPDAAAPDAAPDAAAFFIVVTVAAFAQQQLLPLLPQFSARHCNILSIVTPCSRAELMLCCRSRIEALMLNDGRDYVS